MDIIEIKVGDRCRVISEPDDGWRSGTIGDEGTAILIDRHFGVVAIKFDYGLVMNFDIENVEKITDGKQ